MALIKCTECGKEISDKASSCPNCGCPLTTDASDKNKIIEKTGRNYNQIITRIKGFSRKKLAIIFGAIAIIVIFLCVPKGVDKDKSMLEDCLLEPDSLIIYQAYSNNDYGDGGHATLFYFGAQNKAGGISDDWALVYDGDVQFYSDFKDAEKSGDNKGILENGDIVEAKFAVSIGNENWKEVNIK